MFYIEDGREHFYQWDIDRCLVVEDETVTEVHFCNRTGDCSLVCEVYTHDNDFGGVRVVNVPNILLQTDWRIHVFAWDGKHTKHDACFEVKSRTKPSDYVYTETEVISVEKVVEDALEEAAASGEFKGESGVYVGTEAPEDPEMLVWINPEGEASDEIATKEYVLNEIATFDFIKVVDELPAEGMPNRIYLVPKADTQTQDLFDEYIWINGKWEWLTTKQMEVDLTGYVPKTAFVYDEAAETLSINI